MLIIFTEAFCVLGLAELALRLGFGTVCSIVRRCPVLNWRRSTPEQMHAVCWAVDEAAIWYFKRVQCLQRSVVATILLRLHGIDAELVIGHRQVPFQSHAWVEVNGEVVNDRRQYCKLFTPIERLQRRPTVSST